VKLDKIKERLPRFSRTTRAIGRSAMEFQRGTEHLTSAEKKRWRVVLFEDDF